MNRLKELRLSHGLTLQEIGNLLNVGKSTVFKYEQGTIPLTAEQLKILASYFGVTVDYLLMISNDIKRDSVTIQNQLEMYASDNLSCVEEVDAGFNYLLDLAKSQAGDLIEYYIYHHELDATVLNDLIKLARSASTLCEKRQQLCDKIGSTGLKL